METEPHRPPEPWTFEKSSNESRRQQSRKNPVSLCLASLVSCPIPHRAVVAAAGNQPAVGAKAGAPHEVGVLSERLKRYPRLKTANDYRAVGTTTYLG